MDSSEEEQLALLSVILFDNKSRRKQAKKRCFWVREIIQRHEEHGVFSNLVSYNPETGNTISSKSLYYANYYFAEYF